jgi:hypothetical protein
MEVNYDVVVVSRGRTKDRGEQKTARLCLTLCSRRLTSKVQIYMCGYAVILKSEESENFIILDITFV